MKYGYVIKIHDFSQNVAVFHKSNSWYCCAIIGKTVSFLMSLCDIL